MIGSLNDLMYLLEEPSKADDLSEPVNEPSEADDLPEPLNESIEFDDLPELLKKSDEFEDLSEPFDYQYRDYEYLMGMEFSHLGDGLYTVRMPFAVTFLQWNKLSEEYEGIVFALYMDEKWDQGIDINRYSTFGYIQFAWSKYYARRDADGFDEYIKSRKDWPEVKKRWCSTKMRFLGSRGRSAVTLPSVLSGNRYRGKSDKLSFILPDENNMCHGYPKHIFINGFVGYMFMPGIYYFGNDGRPKIRDDIRMEKRTAVIGYESVFPEMDEISVVYLAIDQDHFQTLRNIKKYSGKKFLFHEFPLWKEEEEYGKAEPKEPSVGKKELKCGLVMEKDQYVIAGLSGMLCPAAPY